MSQIKVKIPVVKAGSYKISIGKDILGSLWDRIEADFQNKSFFVVTDSNLVSAGHLEKLLVGRDVPTYIIDPPGETSKNIDTVVAIVEKMEKGCFGRDACLVALGGGTVGDIAGFAAAIFKRGVQVVQIPTTPVSQADSSVGGKTGVDSSLSKNAFGAFWQPATVYIDVATLATLETRVFCAGLVESIKHALIADEKYFDFLDNNIDAICDRQFDVLEKMAQYNCKIKAAVVEADPYEKNQRRCLNYGHTIGHAVETASGFDLLHGEAVAIGIIGASLIEIKMGLGDNQRLKKIRDIFAKIGVPTTISKDLGKETLIGIIKRDKKAINMWPRFVLIDKIGHVYCMEGQWAVEVPRDMVENVIDQLYE
ncbi:3-dehydroquinate synthase [Planctomycetota bacterium]